MSLNPPQLAAVKTASGPLLVLAGAGTGKTRVVTHRIAELIRRGTPPERILAVTFTKKAAGEMQQRITALLPKKSKARPQVSTFHSLCVKVLRRQIERLGYPRAFSIYDRSDQESAARQALKEIRMEGQSLRPSDLLYFISRWKCASASPAEAANLAASDREHLAAVAYRRYQSALKSRGAVDFDDLLLITEELFRRFPEVRRAEAERFDHVLVDEYQDTNGAQYRIVQALARDHRNLCVVGDDDQSIYGWRGAEVAHILRFQRDWPEAKIVRLEDNYRSTAEILEMANRLIAFNRGRHEKALRSPRSGPRPRILQFNDELEEARAVATEIRSQISSRQAAAGDFAVLFRTNEQPRLFETEFRRVELPYVLIGGQSFFDRKEVRDILAYLKLLVRPEDDPALLRVLNTPPRGIGQATAKKLIAQAVEQGTSVWEMLGRLEAGVQSLEEERKEEGAEVEDAWNELPPASSLQPPASSLPGIRRFCELIQRYRERLKSAEKSGALAGLARSLIADIRYEQELERAYPNANDRALRWNMVESVVNALAEYEEHAADGTLLGFLDDVTLDGRDDTNDKESKLRRDAVVLMTLHSAKGLEFPQVYLVGMEEGLLPHRKSVAAEDNPEDDDPPVESPIEEERRLCYVGMTRAQHKLTMTMALTRRKWGKARPTHASRFLFEMTGKAEPD